MSSLKAVVRCICGEKHTVRVNGRRVRCSCDALLKAGQNQDGTVTPWARIKENSLSVRKAAGKIVLHRKPKIVEWR